MYVYITTAHWLLANSPPRLTVPATAFVFAFLESVHALPCEVLATHFIETARFFDEHGPATARCAQRPRAALPLP